MPPPMITIVTPTVSTPMIDAEVMMISRLAGVANVSAVATPITQSTASTPTSPRLRPTLVSSRPASRAFRGAGSPGTARLTIASRTLIPAPFHDQVEHAGLVELAARCLVHHPPVAQYQHPVGQPEHLGHVAGHQHHGHSLLGQPSDQRVDLATGTDVDAA